MCGKELNAMLDFRAAEVWTWPNGAVRIVQLDLQLSRVACVVGWVSRPQSSELTFGRTLQLRFDQK